MGTSDTFQQSVTVEFRHGEIGDNQGEVILVAENLPGIFAINGFNGLEMILQDLACRDPDNL